MAQAVTWINGSFVETDAATVPAFDAGLQHAVGLFETMLATRGRVISLHDHLNRLSESARALALTSSLRLGPLSEAVQRAVERSQLAEGEGRARVRLTLTGGDLNLLNAGGEDARTPTVVIHVSPAQRYPDELFDRGISAVIADARANPLNPHEGHKTLNYWWRLRELQRASASGAGECLILQVTNHVAGGAVSNLFAVKGGHLRTPIARGEEDRSGKVGLPAPVLPGITRGAVIELAEQMGAGTARQMLSIDDLLDADELFLTNSSWGILPVVRLEQSAIGDGMPGGLTRALGERYERVVLRGD